MDFWFKTKCGNSVISHPSCYDAAKLIEIEWNQSNWKLVLYATRNRLWCYSKLFICDKFFNLPMWDCILCVRVLKLMVGRSSGKLIIVPDPYAPNIPFIRFLQALYHKTHVGGTHISPIRSCVSNSYIIYGIFVGKFVVFVTEKSCTNIFSSHRLVSLPFTD